MTNWRDRFLITAVVLTGLVVGVGCSKTDAPKASDDQNETPDPLADAPEDWQAFLAWVELELSEIPPAISPPTDPNWPPPKWDVLHLDQVLDQAKIRCTWQPPTEDRKPLAELGPFRSDQPAQNLRVIERKEAAVPNLLMTVSGFTVQCEDVGSIEIECRQPVGPSFELLWSQAGVIRVPVPDNERFWTLTIQTDGFAEWKGPLYKIGLRTVGIGRQPVEVRSIRFWPREESFPKPVGITRVRMEREIRSVLYTHCPSEIRFDPITLPKRAKLQLGLAKAVTSRPHRPSDKPPPSQKPAAVDTPDSFEVLIEHDGSTIPVLTRPIGRTGRWYDETVSLETWSGRTVALILRTKADPASVICLANPVIYESLPDPPCVIIYLIDALAAKHCSLYGYDRPTTPRLDELASNGVWFANAFANSPRTIESVADLMLSMPTEQHGVYYASARAPDELVTLAESLRAAGFATASFCTNVNAGPRQNIDQGFDHFFDIISYWWSRADRTVPINDVMAWLRMRRDRPTFLYIHTAEPHAPYTPPLECAGRFSSDYVGPVDGNLDGSRGFQSVRTPRDIAHLTALYDEEVVYADAQLGRLINALERAEFLPQTHFFVTADHGEEFKEHGWWTHGYNVYNEVQRIPLVAAGPLVTARGRHDTPVQLFDLMPTVLAMFDLPVPYALAGQSLMPLLSGRETERRHAQPSDQPNTRRPSPPTEIPSPDPNALGERLVFASSYFHKELFGDKAIVEYAVIEAGRWKLMYRYAKNLTQLFEGADRFVLFDLHADFNEKNNVIDSQREKARYLIGRLIQWRRRQAPFETGLPAHHRTLDGDQLRELRSLGYIK